MKQLLLAKRVPITCIDWGLKLTAQPSRLPKRWDKIIEEQLADGYVINNNTGEIYNVTYHNVQYIGNQLEGNGFLLCSQKINILISQK